MQVYDRITIALPKDLADWVKEQARRENRSVSNYIVTILLKNRGGKEIECISVR